MQRSRTLVLLAASAALVAAAVWFAGQAQRSTSSDAAKATSDAEHMLTARLDEETGLRGFLLTDQRQFLQPYLNGRVDFRRAAASAAKNISGSQGQRLLANQQRLTAAWERQAHRAIVARQAGQPIATRTLTAPKRAMDRFRDANRSLVALTADQAKDRQNHVTLILFGLIAVLGVLTVAVGYLLIERPAKRDARRRTEEAEFSEVLQFATDEPEAQDLVRRELERALPGSSAAVLSRNNSENRLEVATALPDESTLQKKLPGATPESCLSVRRARRFDRQDGKQHLLECKLCGAEGKSSICVPSLVGGEVIGSVLVSRIEGQITDRDIERVEQTVGTAAPVLANLRNLAIAETRAVTDSLTGLANARAASEDLARMVAFAGRSITPLAAILLDLDHFKRVNDAFGHQVGDEVLAALGDALPKGTRTSDLVARYGGEEFLVLMQDTDTQAAVEVAEKLRDSVRQIHVPGLTARLSASFGVASIPDDAADGESLVRAADQALYAAKDAGRDCVRTASEIPAHRNAGEDAEPVDGTSKLERHFADEG